MKRIFLLLAGVVSMMLAVACNKNDDKDRLPALASDFISAYWPQASIGSVVKDEGEYKVFLNEGTHIEFDRKGNWEEVNNIHGIVTAFLPAALTQHTGATYTSAFIVSVSKDKRKYEVELSNHLDLEFDLQGNFLRIDD